MVSQGHEIRIILQNCSVGPCLDHVADFYRKGWTCRTAAPLLGVHFTHLHKVLIGRRESQSLLNRVLALPSRRRLV